MESRPYVCEVVLGALEDARFVMRRDGRINGRSPRQRTRKQKEWNKGAMANEERRKRRHSDRTASVVPTDVVVRDKTTADERPSPAVEEPRTEIPRQSIEQRAYERFLERGGGHGSDVDDWLEAERELELGGKSD